MPWYLVDPFNSIIHRIFEAGLYKHVQELADFMFGLTNGLNHLSGDRVATWSDYESSFDFLWYGHAIGLGFASVVCVSEIMIFKWKCTRFE